MPEVVALVSADDAVAAVRVHADRVHDLLRRTGIPAEESLEVAETYAIALVDTLVQAPSTVGDMAGWWFGRIIETARRVGDVGAVPVQQASSSVLAGEGGEETVRSAMAGLPEAERIAVILRDAYDLPAPAVQVALRRDGASLADLVASGRLRLVRDVEQQPTPALPSHPGRLAVSVAALGQLADGSLPPAQAIPLRRHVGSCSGCEDVLAALQRGRRMLAGLPVIAMSDRARLAMLDRVTARAAQVLPSYDEIVRAVESDDVDRPAVSRLLALAVIVLAAVLGVGIGRLSRASGASPLTGVTVPTISPSDAPLPSLVTSLLQTPSATPRPSPVVRIVTPSPASTPTPSPTPSATPSTTRAATVTDEPSSGPSGAATTVSGTGFTPGSVVSVSYPSETLTGTTQETAQANVDDAGTFSVTVNPSGPPATYPIEVTSDAGDAASTDYTITQ